jgi:hypothetical protein
MRHIRSKRGPFSDRPHFKLSEIDASGCMQWRWLYDKISVVEFVDQQKYRQQGFKAAVSFMSDNIPMLRMIRNTALGYCGLAGKEID